VETDVVIVGAGVTGLTAAYLLAKAGKRVVVLERDRCAMTDTGHTTAHLTMVTDARLTELAKRFGRDHAQAVWDAGLAAIATIDEVVREHAIDAGFEWVDGYLHSPLNNDESEEPAKGLRPLISPRSPWLVASVSSARSARLGPLCGAQRVRNSHNEAHSGPKRLEEDATLAREMGFDAEFVATLPLMNRPGIRFADQARIHPRSYLAGVAKAFVALGGRIYEHSTADGFCDAPRSVKVAGHTVRCEDIILATHNPLVGLSGLAGATLFQTKLALYTSYVIAGRVPHGTVPDALWWDTGDPYNYLRVESHRDFDVIVFGGEDHKTGQQDDTAGCYQRLEERLTRIVPRVDVTHRWSGQVIETPDGLPYIGQTVDHQYAATGYAGNGMTFGTLAGMMMSDAILDRTNPWRDLFDPSRKAITRGVWDYLEENVDYPYYLIRDRFAGAEAKSLRAVKRGQGKVIERDGAKVAAYRDPSGAVTLRSATCTHMGCVVGWNTAERTWDCPCHGSRFKPSGDVISGPAEAPLSDVE
jgi:glycine/D-amino acid oxidase-like deaminating enzyme/nitrite reductase/ring-hydroxylating ferredoxin subunit